ncbi:MAG: transcriptional regulator [Planctomycetes bacterium]|nr:transcriptional regulator [Planctomycetota bacterium]
MGKPAESHRPTSGRYSYERLDRVLHEKARLGILTSLLTHPDGLVFNELKELCALTDGNLSRHLQVLHGSGIVEIWKGFRDNRPQTLCRLSPFGRERFHAYLEELERVLSDVARSTAKIPTTPSTNPVPGPDVSEGLAPA